MVAEIKDIFAMYDEDGDGLVQTNDIKTIMISLNLNPTKTEVDEIIRLIDPSGRGSFTENALC